MQNPTMAAYFASWRLQFSVLWTMCKFGAVQLGFRSFVFVNAFLTKDHMRLTSLRFNLFRSFSVEGSGQPCSEKSTNNVSSFSFGNCWMNLTPLSTAESIQQGRRPQFMTRLCRLAYPSISASLMSSEAQYQ